jgi:hypothetical protein
LARPAASTVKRSCGRSTWMLATTNRPCSNGHRRS